MTWMHYSQAETLRRSRQLLADFREARLDLAKGFLHLTLSGDSQSPFQRETGLALLDQAFVMLQEAHAAVGSLAVEPTDPDLPSAFRAKLSAFRHQLTEYGQDAIPAKREHELSLFLSFHELEGLAQRVDDANRDALQVVKSRLNVQFALTLAASVALLGVLCVGMYLAGRRRQRAEAAQQESRNRLDFALQASHTGAWTLNVSDQTATRTAIHARIFGYQTAEGAWTLAKFLEHVLPEDRERAQQLIQKSIAARTDFDVECRIRRADGEIRWIFLAGGFERAPGRAGAHVAGIVQDITERKVRERELARMTRLYATLSQINQAIVRVGSREELAREVSRVAVVFGGFKLAWVGQHNAQTREVSPLGHAGEPRGLVHDFRHSSDDSARQRCLCSPAIRDNRACVINDLSVQPEVRDWQSAMEQAGIRAAAVFPVRVRGAVWGVFGVYANEPGVFHDKEIALLEEAAMDIGYAIEHLESEGLRRRAESQLRESEERFRALFEQAAVGVAEIDSATGRFLHVNQRYGDIVGYSREEMLGLDFQTLTHPEDLAADLAQMERLKSGAIRDFAMEKRYRRKDGAFVWVALTVSPLWAPGASPTRHVAVVQDITDRKRAEEALQESEARFRTLVEQAPDGIFIQTQRRFAYVNAAAVRLFGATDPGQLLGELVESRMHPDCRAQVRERIRLLNERHEAQPPADLVYVQLDGSPRSVSVSAVPFELKGEQGALVFARDTTERKRAEAALRESEERFTAFMTHLPGAAFLKDESGRTLFVNPYLRDLLGMRDWSGKDTPELVSGALGQQMAADDRKVLAEGAMTIEEVMADTHGVQRTFETVKFPVRIEGGPTLLGGVSLDISGRKRAELESELQVEFLREVNTRRSSRELIEAAVRFVQQHSGCEAVGIRLREGDDYPYFEARGFPQEFLQLENSLCVRDADGRTVLDSAGNPKLECMCGNVICGRFDPGKSFFTKSGSFWANDTTRLLATTTPADRQANTRNRCNGMGYESVALVPLIAGGERLGLLQLNDHRKGMFTPEGIALWERVAGYLAVALAKCRAEEALRESEERLRLFVEHAPAALAMFDRKMRYMAVSRRWISDYGLEGKEILGRSHYEVFPEIGEDLKYVHRRGLAGEVMWADDDRFERADGSMQYVRWEMHPWRDRGGGIGGIVIFTEDITERKLAEEALRASETRRALALDAAQAGTWEWDLTTGRNIWSEELWKLYGLAPRSCEPSYEAWRATVHPSEREQVERELQTLVQQESELSLEWRVNDAGANPRWLLSCGRPLRDESGRVVRYLGVVMDITKRRQAEEAVRQRLELQDQLAKVASTVPGMICSFRLRPDGTWCMPFATSMIEEIYGLRAEEVRDDFAPAFATMHPDDVEHVRDSIAASARSLTPWRDTFRVRHPQKGERWVEGHSMPSREADGGILWHGFVQDVTDRKRAEQALQESRERFRGLVETTFDWVWEVDERGRYTYASPKSMDLLGYSPEEVLGRSPFEFMPEAEAQRVGAIFQDIIARRISFSFLENVNLHKSGRQVVLETSGAPVFGPDGSFCGYRGMDRDISARKQAEAALQEREEIFSKIVGQAMDAIALVDGETGRFVEFNVAAHEGLGYTREEFAAIGVAEIQAEHSREVIARNISTIRSQGGLSFESQHRRRDGGLRDVRVSARPLDIRGRNYIAAVWTDITERKRAEAALRDSEARFRSLVEAAPEALFVQCGGIFRYVNAAMVKLVGAAQEGDLLGQPFNERVAPEYHEAIRERIRMQQDTGAATPPMEQEYLRLDGTRVPVETTAIAIRYEGQKGNLVFLRDITARRKTAEERANLEAQLQQAQKLEAIGTVAGGVAHEINNPIMGIMNYAEIIIDEVPKDSAIAGFAREIRHETDRVAGIVKNLLGFARQDQQGQSPARLGDIVEATLTLIRTVMRHDQITLEVDVPENLPKIRCRNQQIQQVLMNLLTNARDALNTKYPDHAAGKIVRISARELSRADSRAPAENGRQAGEGGASESQAAVRRSFIRLTVEDHGCGIPKAIRQRIFDPFFTTKPRDKGTGLGLSISHGIVKNHGGEMSVESEEGQWTRFHVDLPLAGKEDTEEPEAAAVTETRAQGPEPSVPGRILVVDDDESIRKTLCMFLQDAGHEVRSASNGKEAAALAVAMPDLDVVITDILMPETDGLVLIRALRKSHPRTAIIAISGGGHIEAQTYLNVADKFGADVVRAKPVSRDDLLADVAALMRRGRS